MTVAAENPTASSTPPATPRGAPGGLAIGTGVAGDDPLGRGGRNRNLSKTTGTAQLAGTAAPAQTTTR